MAVHLSSLEGISLHNTWLTIGSFDGVHTGHQRLIKDLQKNARLVEGRTVVLTFHPHPSVILLGRMGKFYLTTVSEKVKLLDGLGVDIIVTHPFTLELSQSTAKDFISYLCNHLGFSQLWVGEDFALGKGREGNVNYLTNLGTEMDFRVKVVLSINSGGKKISSSYIRNLITEGKIEEANSLLGRKYQLSGEVVHGDGRGKSIGVPTANLETGNEKLTPGSGVYACQVHISDRLYAAAVNIGSRPTFESIEPKAHIEAHILDYSDDLYSQQIEIEFVSRLRGEQRFNSVDELITQIHKDIEKTREIISEKIKN